MFSLKNIILTVVSLGLLVVAYAYVTRISEERFEINSQRAIPVATNEITIPAGYNKGTEQVITIIPNYTYSATYSSAQKQERLKMWDDLLQSIYKQINCTGNGCIQYELSATCNNKATTTIFLKRDGGDEDIKLYIDIERARSQEFHLEYGC